MNSNIFKLNWADIEKGIALVAITAFLGAVQQALSAHGIDIRAYDWGGILNISLSAGLAYLVKNFFSDNTGAVLGAFGGRKY